MAFHILQWRTEESLKLTLVYIITICINIFLVVYYINLY